MRRRSPHIHIILIGLLAATAASSGCFESGPSTVVLMNIHLPSALLWPQMFPALVVEIDYVEGREPSDLALQALADTLHNITQKPEIIILPPTLIANHKPDPSRKWDDVSLMAFHDATFDQPVADGQNTMGQTAYLHVLYVDGHVEPRARGLQIQNLLVILKDQFDDVQQLPTSIPPLPSTALMERRVLIHELGHAFGLVNCGIPMIEAREHSDSRCHSNRKESVMAVGVHHTYAVLEYAQEGKWAPHKFDAWDLADLDAYREEGAWWDDSGTVAVPPDHQSRAGFPLPESSEATIGRFRWW